MFYTDTAADRLSKAYGSSEISDFSGTLGPLLEMLVDLLMDCFAGGSSAEGIIQRAKSPDLRLRLGLRLRARRAGLDPERATAALLSVGSAAVPSEVSGFIAENLG